MLPSFFLAFYICFTRKHTGHNICPFNHPSHITLLKRPKTTAHDFNISSLQLSRSRLCRFRASSGKYALLYGLSLSVISIPGSFPLPLLWSSRACALLLSSASLCKRSARNLSMELEKTDRFCHISQLGYLQHHVLFIWDKCKIFKEAQSSMS